MFWRAAKMVIPCEPQIRCMRTSDTTYVAEGGSLFLSRENKSGSGLCSPRLLSSFNHVRHPASHRPLVRSRPSQSGAATNRRDFSGSAVQPGLQFSLDEPIFSRSAASALHSHLVEPLRDLECCLPCAQHEHVHRAAELDTLLHLPSAFLLLSRSGI